jgi:hypothetical protein
MSTSFLLESAYIELDELLLSFRYEEAKQRLLAYATGDHPLTVLLGVMVITNPWRDQLKEARHEVFVRILQEAHEQGGDDKVGDNTVLMGSSNRKQHPLTEL